MLTTDGRSRTVRTAPMSDSLLTQIAAGSLDAVNDCIRKYNGPIWSLARRFLPTEHDAEDALQEVFLELWKSAHRFDPLAGSELTFVMTIARRRLIDRGRKLARRPATDSLAEPEILPDQEITHPEETREETERVHAAMGQLRPEQREVLQLSLLQGHSHQQVADRTGLPLGTVKSHARRGLMRVRELLGQGPSPSGGES
jgi:RNA polymerase sigma-70 factor (ECF subfamily)